MDLVQCTRSCVFSQHLYNDLVQHGLGCTYLATSLGPDLLCMLFLETSARSLQESESTLQVWVIPNP